MEIISDLSDLSAQSPLSSPIREASEKWSEKVEKVEEPEAFPVTLEIIMLPADKEFILFLTKQGNVSENELRQCGEIIIQSLRSYC